MIVKEVEKKDGVYFNISHYTFYSDVIALRKPTGIKQRYLVFEDLTRNMLDVGDTFEEACYLAYRYALQLAEHYAKEFSCSMNDISVVDQTPRAKAGKLEKISIS